MVRSAARKAEEKIKQMMNNNSDDDKSENTNTNGGIDVEDEDLGGPNISEIQEEGLNQTPHPNKKKRYHRHTHHQIQEMEAFFKECPHPDDKQRKELSKQLGLDHLQIKFWFQNKRTQNKNHHERLENAQLRTENDKLRADNHHYRDAISNASCPKCGNQTAIGEMSFEEHHLRLDNARLEEEVVRLSVLAEKSAGKMVMNYPAMSPPVPPRPFDFWMGSGDVYGNGGNFSGSITGLTDRDKSKIIELAVGAMEELMKMAQAGEPLWKMGIVGTSIALNMDEYKKTFRKGLGPKPIVFRTEASRETSVMVMNPINIVEMLIDVNQWSKTFAGIIGRATTTKVLSTGDGELNGALQVINAEFQVLSPLVPTREVVFARYCKKQGDGLWAVVDVSVDHIHQNLDVKCRRRPSGCLIQEIQNGYSKVTWVEHMEVDDRGGVPTLFRNLIGTGQAFGAKRWVSTLDRHCERVTNIIMATSFPSLEFDGSITLTNQGKKGILKLAERLTRSFFSGLTISTMDFWTTLSGDGDNVKVMTRKSSGDPGRPSGIILCAATTFWLPISPRLLFEFLRDENTRTTWDILCVGGSVEKISHIGNGRDIRNCASLLECTNNKQEKLFLIQESSTDPTASFVVYSPVDISDLNVVLSGADPDYLALLPSGFAILPDGTGPPGREGGSLLTVAFQILVESSPAAPLTYSNVSTIESMMLATVNKIKALFDSQSP